MALYDTHSDQYLHNLSAALHPFQPKYLPAIGITLALRIDSIHSSTRESLAYNTAGNINTVSKNQLRFFSIALFCYQKILRIILHHKSLEWKKFENSFYASVIFVRYNASLYIPFFWVDDYYITGAVANAVNATYAQLGSLYTIPEQLAHTRFMSTKSFYTIMFGHFVSAKMKILNFIKFHFSV